MSNVTIRVSEKGGGKTKWLLDVANESLERNLSVGIYSGNDKEYQKFCDKFVSLYGKVCKVTSLSNMSCISDVDIILIDNLFEHNIPMEQVRYLRRSCKELYITIEGKDSSEIKTSEIDGQISIEEYLRGIPV